MTRRAHRCRNDATPCRRAYRGSVFVMYHMRMSCLSVCVCVCVCAHVHARSYLARRFAGNVGESAAAIFVLLFQCLESSKKT